MYIKSLCQIWQMLQKAQVRCYARDTQVEIRLCQSCFGKETAFWGSMKYLRLLYFPLNLVKTNQPSFASFLFYNASVLIKHLPLPSNFWFIICCWLCLIIWLSTLATYILMDWGGVAFSSGVLCIRVWNNGACILSFTACIETWFLDMIMELALSSSEKDDMPV